MNLRPLSGGSSAETLDPRAVLEVCLCHNVRRAARAISRAYDTVLAPAGLTCGQFTILAAVAALNPMPLPVLREVLALDRTSLSRTLKPLEERGLLDLSAGAGRRPGQVSLTAEGEAAFREAAALWRAAQAETSQKIGPGRTGQLLALTAAATASLRS